MGIKVNHLRVIFKLLLVGIWDVFMYILISINNAIQRDCSLVSRSWGGGWNTRYSLYFSTSRDEYYFNWKYSWKYARYTKIYDAFAIVKFDSLARRSFDIFQCRFQVIWKNMWHTLLDVLKNTTWQYAFSISHVHYIIIIS